MLMKGFNTKRAINLILIIGVIIRVMVGLGSYSGEHDYPLYGDFEAHRNWMSITVNR